MKDKEASGTSLNQVDVAFLRASRAGNLEKVRNFLNEDGDIHTCNANGLNALHLSSKEGHVEVVRELLRRGAGVNVTTKKGNTALHIASLAGQKTAVEVLLDAGASVNSKAQNGFTPLYMAAQEGHVDVVRVLLSKGANQQVTTEDGFTPIDVAVQQGHEKVVAALLHHDSRKGYRSLHTAARKDFAKAAKLLLQKDHKPDVEAPNGFTPLHIAAKYGNRNVASVLVQHGATIDYKTKNYVIAPLHVASKYGNLNIVTLLVEKGSKVDIPNKDGLTPLHCAARDGQDKVVDYLVQKNASITARTKHGLTPLHMSCQGNNVSTSSLLIDSKAPVNAVAANGLTPLHIAAHYGHVDIAQLLLDRGADTDARARNGFTPLHVACKKNREQVIQLLLKYGANVHSANEGGQTPMHVATYYGNVTLVLILLEHGGSPDITNVRGETALHIACRRRHITIVRLLLRNGAAVDAKTQDRETPLHIAVRTKNTEMVKLLLDQGASPDALDKNKCTPLHIAARDGNEELVETLLEHGASVNILSKKGFTPLHEAARHGHVRIVEILLNSYDNPDPEGKHGLTPLHVATHYNKTDVATFLLEHDANPNAAAKNGFTPLHIAAKKNRIDIVLLLLKYGVDPDITTQTGISPLHLAAKEGHVELCEHLVENGALPGVTTNNGLTPLHLAARENRIDVAKLLLKYNAPINAQTVSGFTPLHIACVYGHYELARLLLDAGADIEAKTKNGYMALHLAAQYGHQLIIEILLERGASPDALTNEGYTALYIAQRVQLNTTIIERLSQVTVVTQTITITRRPGEEDDTEGAIVFSAEPEELEEEGVLEELEQAEVEEEPLITEESYDRYMTMEEMVDDESGRSSSLISRDSGIFSSSRYSGAFFEGTPTGSRASDLDRSRLSDFNISENIQTSEMIMVESELPSSLADMVADNVPKYEPPVTGDFLISFLVDARGGKMESSQSGLRVTLPPKSCQMPTRFTYRQHRLNKPSLLPPIGEGESLACRILDVSPSGLKFLQPIYLELPHFSALRNGERELVVLRTEDGGWTWREVCVEDMKAVDGYSSDMNIHQGFIPSKRYARIETQDLPEKFAIVSRLTKESFAVGPKGEVIKSSVLPQVQVKIPQGALSEERKITLQAQPVDESFNDYEDWVAVSPVLTLDPPEVTFAKPVTITIPTPLFTTGGSSMDIQPSLRLLSCKPKNPRHSAPQSPAYEWLDITDTTPLTVVNECASFTTNNPGRYWLLETRNPDNVTADARLLYRKLTAVPYSAKFVVFAKVTPDGSEARLRIFCITDDSVNKTLEEQTGFVEVARSRDVEVCEGRPVYVRCIGNIAPVNREPLQLTFSPFHENRLPVTVRVTDPAQSPTCRLAFLKEPRKDRQGNIRTICNLNIDLSEENLRKEDPSVRLPDELLSLVGKEVGADWIALGQELGFEDSDLQEVKDKHPDAPDECATEILKKWRDREDTDANMANLEKALHDMGRPDIAENFKKLAYSSYSKQPTRIVKTHHVTTTYTESSGGSSGNRRISEFLDSAANVDEMFVDDTVGSPRHQRSSEADKEDVFTESRTVTVESSPEHVQDIDDETVIVVEKHRIVDEDGNLIEETETITQDGVDVTNSREKLIQDFFSDDKGVLDFFSGDSEKAAVRSEESTDETEI